MKKSKENIKLQLKRLFFVLCRVFPLRDKVVATTMRGRKYGDNPQFIFERLHDKKKQIDFVWLVNDEYTVELPNWVRRISYYKHFFRLAFELSTAKVWINTHRFERFWCRRPGQFIIETWHGGLGIKKIEGDLEEVRNSKRDMDEIGATCKLSDVFITQSSHLGDIYRSAFGYKGKIWKIGYPKNDQLVKKISQDSVGVHNFFDIGTKKIALYAPTMREGDQDALCPTLKPYTIEWDQLVAALKRRFEGEWVVFVKWHPVLVNKMPTDFIQNPNVIDVSKYQDMQALIESSDVMISDYSSCIFDGALLEIPCFTYATDFEEYKQKRGVYYEMQDLPFPYARNNDELINNVQNFSYEDYKRKWNAFKEKVGLYETGHAADDIAEKIIEFIERGRVKWNVTDMIL